MAADDNTEGDWLARVFDRVPDEPAPAPNPARGNVAPLEGGNPDAPGPMEMGQDARAFVDELFGRGEA